MGFQARAALTVNGYYGSKNPSCKSESKPVRDTTELCFLDPLLGLLGDATTPSAVFALKADAR